MLYLRVKEHTTLEEETLARLDDQGNLRPTAEVQAELEQAAHERGPVRKRDLSLVRM